MRVRRWSLCALALWLLSVATPLAQAFPAPQDGNALPDLQRRAAPSAPPSCWNVPQRAPTSWWQADIAGWMRPGPWPTVSRGTNSISVEVVAPLWGAQAGEILQVEVNPCFYAPFGEGLVALEQRPVTPAGANVTVERTADADALIALRQPAPGNLRTASAVFPVAGLAGPALYRLALAAERTWNAALPASAVPALNIRLLPVPALALLLWQAVAHRRRFSGRRSRSS